MAIEYVRNANPPAPAIDAATAATLRKLSVEMQPGGKDAVHHCARDPGGCLGETGVGAADFAAAGSPSRPAPGKTFTGTCIWAQ